MNNRTRRMINMRGRRKAGAYEVHRDEMAERLQGMDRNGLVSFAMYAPLAECRIAALKMIDDEATLGHIAANSASDDTRSQAVKMIDNPDILRKVVCLTGYRNTVREAMDRTMALERDQERIDSIFKD